MVRVKPGSAKAIHAQLKADVAAVHKKLAADLAKRQADSDARDSAASAQAENWEEVSAAGAPISCGTTQAYRIVC